LRRMRQVGQVFFMGKIDNCYFAHADFKILPHPPELFQWTGVQ
jgi:hypothetical protein